MQSDLQKRIFANVLLDPNPEHAFRSRRQGFSISTLVAIALAATGTFGLIVLYLANVRILPY